MVQRRMTRGNQRKNEDTQKWIGRNGQQELQNYIAKRKEVTKLKKKKNGLMSLCRKQNTITKIIEVTSKSQVHTKIDKSELEIDLETTPRQHKNRYQQPAGKDAKEDRRQKKNS